MALIQSYLDLTAKYIAEYGDKTLLLMQVGSFMEVYALKNVDSSITGSRIEEFSRICDLNIVTKNVQIDGREVVFAGHKDVYVERYVRKMQDEGFTVVVYMQDELKERHCTNIFSPGTYFADDSTALSNNLMCIWLDTINNSKYFTGKRIVVGVANLDIFTGKTSIFQFQESGKDPMFDDLERFVSIHNPSETIIVHCSNDVDALISCVDLRSATIHRIDAHKVGDYEKQSFQSNVLRKFYKNSDNFAANFYDNDVAARAFCYLLDFAHKHNPNLVHKIGEPAFDNCSNRLLLANHSLRQLNIIDDASNYKGKHSSVLSFLNCCMTPMGKRLFAHNLVNPTTDEVWLQGEYDMTEKLLATYESADVVGELRRVKDLNKLERQIAMRTATFKSFVALRESATILGQINKTIIPLSMPAVDSDCDHFIQCISKAIDAETGDICKGYNADLDAKRDQLSLLEKQLDDIRRYLNRLIESREKNGKSAEYVKLHETEKGNLSLICTSRRCKLLTDALPSTNTIVRIGDRDWTLSKTQFEFKSQTATNNEIVDEQIRQLCNQIAATKNELTILSATIFGKFVAEFDTTRLSNIIDFAARIDVAFAKMSIAQKFHYCKPTVVKDKSTAAFLDAKGLRHCLIERINDAALYVSNDVQLKNDGILLYGTNAVGKTSLIRAIGISVIMAQAGLYVPCSEFVYKPFSQLFTRIVGNDNLFKGLSTFAVEMSELRAILRLSNANSLILGDELCSGTENTSAASIFIAGIQKLRQLKSSFIFATHLHEIVDYEEVASVTMKHMTVFYDKQTDKLVYDRKLKDGSGDSMYGLEVCKSLNMPDDFLRNAYEIRNKYFGSKAAKSSHFNAKKIMDLCEKCDKRIGTEVHHKIPQKLADKNGIIKTGDLLFHKNHLANLMTLCEECHLAEHHPVMI